MPDLSGLEQAVLPVGTLRDAAPHLRRPFSVPAVKWKIQTAWGSGAMIVAHIDARLVIERLNTVLPDAWHDEYEAVGSGLLICRLTVDGVTRQDVGQGQGKALWSDALKRAAVRFGVGVSVYALPQIRLEVGAADAQLRTRTKGQKQEPVIDDRTLARLRAGYESWLAKAGTGVSAFGPVLDHGDVEDSQGADEEDAVVGAGEGDAVVESALPALETPEAIDAIDAIERVYAVVRKVDARRLPPGEFRRKLNAAAHSMEEIEALYVEIDRLREEVLA